MMRELEQDQALQNDQEIRGYPFVRVNKPRTSCPYCDRTLIRIKTSRGADWECPTGDCRFNEG